MMVKTYPKIGVLKHQAEFIKSEYRHTGMVAGFGAGKSRAATWKTIAKKLKYPGVDVAYYLPTYSLIEDIAYPNFEELLEQRGIAYRLNKGTKSIETAYGKIIFRSMDTPAYIVGYKVGYSLIDEADILPMKKMNVALKNIVARNRAQLPNDDKNQLDFVSTPEGFQFMYDFFVRKANKNRHLIRAKTSDNHHNPPDYIDTLSEIYTKEQLAAYLNGEFINLTSGNVYYQFDRVLSNSDEVMRDREILHVGMDFNVTKMNAVIHVIRRGDPIAVAEVVDSFDTTTMINVLTEQYKNKGHQIVVYPDASGQQRSTQTSTTDIKLLKKAGFKVIVGKVNPRVKDRVTAMNVAFKNAKDIHKYKVNTEMCPSYAEALEQQTYKNGVPDKDSGHDHITEAAGYFISNRHKKRRASINAG